MNKPHAQRPDHITKEIASQDEATLRRPKDQPNLKEQGPQGNIYQNTHNDGYQQDR